MSIGTALLRGIAFGVAIATTVAAQTPHLSMRAAALSKRLAHAPLDAVSVERLLRTERHAPAFREVLFYGEGRAVRAAARCLVALRDRVTVDGILSRAANGELGPARYPAALFGWVVGASYDAKLVPRIRPMLRSGDPATRLFALHALETLTYVRWAMPEFEPAFANPGRLWAMDRWLRRVHTQEWVEERIRPMLAKLEGAERDRAAAFLARYRPAVETESPVLRFNLRVASARRSR